MTQKENPVRTVEDFVTDMACDGDDILSTKKEYKKFC